MIPLRTDCRLKHTPYVNTALIVVNLLVFLWQQSQMPQNGAMLRQPPAFEYYLDPTNPLWYQFFTYQFLHASWMHLLGNMLFLWVFGNGLEDRLGPVGYGFFYLAGGVIAGVGHALSSTSPVLGASGAVSAVTGAFLALFPLSHVTVVWPIIFIYIFECPSMYVILLAFARDVFYHFADVGGVAYLAHISGNVYGFAIGLTLLATRVLPREPFDFLALLDRWNRRRRFRAAANSGQLPWQAQAAERIGRTKLSADQERAMHLRAEVLKAVQAHDPIAAVAAYEALLDEDHQQVMPRQTQLDVGAFAMHQGRYRTAAAAYEAFCRAFPSDPYGSEVRLILGLIYGRYLADAERARPLLVSARDSHSDATRRAMARQLLAEIG